MMPCAGPSPPHGLRVVGSGILVGVGVKLPAAGWGCKKQQDTAAAALQLQGDCHPARTAGFRPMLALAPASVEGTLHLPAAEKAQKSNFTPAGGAKHVPGLYPAPEPTPNKRRKSTHVSHTANSSSATIVARSATVGDRSAPIRDRSASHATGLPESIHAVPSLDDKVVPFRWSSEAGLTSPEAQLMSSESYLRRPEARFAMPQTQNMSPDACVTSMEELGQEPGGGYNYTPEQGEVYRLAAYPGLFQGNQQGTFSAACKSSMHESNASSMDGDAVRRRLPWPVNGHSSSSAAVGYNISDDSITWGGNGSQLPELDASEPAFNTTLIIKGHSSSGVDGSHVLNRYGSYPSKVNGFSWTGMTWPQPLEVNGSQALHINDYHAHDMIRSHSPDKNSVHVRLVHGESHGSHVLNAHEAQSVSMNRFTPMPLASHEASAPGTLNSQTPLSPHQRQQVHADHPPAALSDLTSNPYIQSPSITTPLSQILIASPVEAVNSTHAHPHTPHSSSTGAVLSTYAHPRTVHAASAGAIHSAQFNSQAPRSPSPVAIHCTQANSQTPHFLSAGAIHHTKANLQQSASGPIPPQSTHSRSQPQQPFLNPDPFLAHESNPVQSTLPNHITFRTSLKPPRVPPQQQIKTRAQRKLTCQIKDVRSIVELRVLLQQHGLHFNAIHTSAALYKVAALLRESKSAQTNSSQVPAASWWLPSVAHSSNYTKAAAATQLPQHSQSSSCSEPQSLPLLLKHSRSSKCSSSAASDKAAATQLLDDLLLPLFMSRLYCMGMRSIANSMWSLATLGYHPGEACLVAVAEKLLHKDATLLSQGNPQEWSNLVWAFALLSQQQCNPQHTGNQSVNETYIRHGVSEIQIMFSPQEAGSTRHSQFSSVTECLSHLDSVHTGGILPTPRTSHIGRPPGVPSASLTPLVQRLLSRIASTALPHLYAYTPQNIANTALAFAKLRFAFNPPLMHHSPASNAPPSKSTPSSFPANGNIAPGDPAISNFPTATSTDNCMPDILSQRDPITPSLPFGTNSMPPLGSDSIPLLGGASIPSHIQSSHHSSLPPSPAPPPLHVSYNADVFFMNESSPVTGDPPSHTSNPQPGYMHPNNLPSPYNNHSVLQDQSTTLPSPHNIANFFQHDLHPLTNAHLPVQSLGLGWQVNSPSENVVVPFFQLLCQVAILKLSEFSFQELSNILWAIASLNFLHPGLVSSSAGELIRRFTSLYHTTTSLHNASLHHTSQHIATCFWAFAKARYSESELVQVLSIAGERALPQFSMQDSCNVLWALSELRVLNHLAWSVIDRSYRLHTLAVSEHESVSHVAPASEHQSVCQRASALGTGSVHSGNGALRMPAAQLGVAGKAELMASIQVVQVLRACALLGVQHVRLSRHVCTVLEKKLACLSGQHVRSPTNQRNIEFVSLKGGCNLINSRVGGTNDASWHKPSSSVSAAIWHEPSASGFMGVETGCLGDQWERGPTSPFGHMEGVVGPAATTGLVSSGSTGQPDIEELESGVSRGVPKLDWLGHADGSNRTAVTGQRVAGLQAAAQEWEFGEISSDMLCNLVWALGLLVALEDPKERGTHAEDPTERGIRAEDARSRKLQSSCGAAEEERAEGGEGEGGAERARDCRHSLPCSEDGAKLALTASMFAPVCARVFGAVGEAFSRDGAGMPGGIVNAIGSETESPNANASEHRDLHSTGALSARETRHADANEGLRSTGALSPLSTRHLCQLFQAHMTVMDANGADLLVQHGGPTLAAAAEQAWVASQRRQQHPFPALQRVLLRAVGELCAVLCPGSKVWAERETLDGWFVVDVVVEWRGVAVALEVVGPHDMLRSSLSDHVPRTFSHSPNFQRGREGGTGKAVPVTEQTTGTLPRQNASSIASLFKNSRNISSTVSLPHEVRCASSTVSLSKDMPRDGVRLTGDRLWRYQRLVGRFGPGRVVLVPWTSVAGKGKKELCASLEPRLRAALGAEPPAVC